MQYQFPLLKNRNPVRLNLNKPIVLYGLSVVSIVLYHVLKKSNFSVAAICSDNPDVGGDTRSYDDIPIITTKCLQIHFPQATIINAVKYERAITRRLAIFGYDADRVISGAEFLHDFELDFSEVRREIYSIIPAFPREIEHLFTMIDIYMFGVQKRNPERKVYLESLDVVVTEACSLKCADCANLMQYYAKPSNADFSLLCSSLRSIIEKCETITELILLGGEPLLYRRLPELLDFLSAFETIKLTKVITNGTLLPDQKLLQALKKNDSLVSISNYPVSKNAIRLYELLNAENISCVLNNVGSWQKCGYFLRPRQKDPLSLQQRFDECCAQNLITLLHGRLYGCPFAAHAENLGAIPASPADSQDVGNAFSGDDMYRLHTREEYLSACAFCPGRGPNSDHIPPALQATKPLSFSPACES